MHWPICRVYLISMSGLLGGVGSLRERKYRFLCLPRVDRGNNLVVGFMPKIGTAAEKSISGNHRSVPIGRSVLQRSLPMGKAELSSFQKQHPFFLHFEFRQNLNAPAPRSPFPHEVAWFGCQTEGASLHPLSGFKSHPLLCTLYPARKRSRVKGGPHKSAKYAFHEL